MSRNILKEDFDSILLDMAKVESESLYGSNNEDAALAWAERQYDTNGCTIGRGLKLLKDFRNNRQDAEIHQIEHYWDFTIYGIGGFNRWYLRWNGEIVFSSHHADRVMTPFLAGELGFDVK